MNNNELLQKVKDDHVKGKRHSNGYAYKDWNDYLSYNDDNSVSFFDAVYDEIAQRYAEAYHAAKLAEVAQGECFTEDKIQNFLFDYEDGKIQYGQFTQFLNAKAAAFAAAKVEGLFTEEQVRECVVKSLVKAAENADLHPESNCYYEGGYCSKTRVDPDSITNPKNIVL